MKVHAHQNEVENFVVKLFLCGSRDKAGYFFVIQKQTIVFYPVIDDTEIISS